MNKTFHNRSGTDAEVIATLTAISQVSARMAKNLENHRRTQTIRGRRNRKCQNERYVHDHRRAEKSAGAINGATNWLAQQFGGASEVAETAEAPAAPAKPALSLEEVRAVLADKLVPGIPLKFESFSKSTVQASCHS